MRIIILIALFVAMSVLPSSAATAQEDKQESGPQGEEQDLRFINWESYREASARSRAANIPLLLYFMTDSDTYCRKMARETYKDPRVVGYLNENFAMATVNTIQLPSLAAKYEVNGLPTLWFLAGDGSRLTHVPGFMSAENLLQLLEFIHTGAYKETDYDQWREHRK
ncbi:hypothetical protein DRQ50_06735 [bacterium]|nr:MAG: hypothetical protein DRQ50_06735 [bacterium]